MHYAEAQSSSTDGVFSIFSRRLERGVLVAPTGDVDLRTASVLDDELRRAGQAAELVVLDLGQVSFMDSTGLRAVISAHQRLSERGACLEVVRVPRQVRRLFELVGVSGYLRIA